jgi:hypothetical protein
MAALGTTGKIENLSERRELSEAAKALLADKAFGHVYLELRQRWFGLLMECPHEGQLQNEYAARLRALDAIPTELGLLLTNYRADVQRAKRDA